jgi:hypothetical protein
MLVRIELVFRVDVGQLELSEAPDLLHHVEVTFDCTSCYRVQRR